jgi:hypothetical protein
VQVTVKRLLKENTAHQASRCAKTRIYTMSNCKLQFVTSANRRIPIIFALQDEQYVRHTLVFFEWHRAQHVKCSFEMKEDFAQL